MVNGPRPDTLTVVAQSSATRGTGPAVSPSTPTLLSRQHTSIYSNLSATTPVLVYGKVVTPLQGQWADEPWSPKAHLVAAAAKPIQLAALEKPVADMAFDDDTESTSAETAAFEDHRTNSNDTLAPTDAVTTTTTTTTAVTNAVPSPSASAHVSFVFRHNPYSSALSRMEMYRCTCEDCHDRQATVGVDVLAGPVGASTYYECDNNSSMGQPVGSYETFDQAYTEEMMYSTPEAAPWNAPAVADTDNYWAPPAVTSFMPPPPPPRITYRVVAESAEPGLDADSAFYLIVMRWYRKMCSVQHQWVLKDGDVCPSPDEARPFEQWVDDIGRWWLKNFENVQVKTSASSGAMRAAATRPVGGFETHATAAVPPRFPQPRRELGSSGLTAAMLDSHNESLPPPRSLTRPRRELPW